MKSIKLSTIMFSIIIVLAMMLSIQNNAFSENWRDGFTRISMLPQGVSHHQCFTANGFVYCAGGLTGNERIDKVWYAKINSDGYLEVWNETTSLPYAVSEHQCFTANGFVYCAGGFTGSRTSQVWYATLNSDGSLGMWQKTTSLPHAVERHQCFTANGFVYFAGGYTGSRISQVWYATLNTDGSLGNWQKTTSLPHAVERHQCFTANGFAYCAGGYADSRTSQVWYANLNTDGSLGNWQETTSLPSKVYSHQCFTVNGFVYCTGGYTDYGRTSNVRNATLKTDGSLGNWQRTNNLPYAVDGHQCFIANDLVYCIVLSNVLIYLDSIIMISTHPSVYNWYITNSFTFNINDLDLIPNGYYYKIDNSSITEITTSNSEYTTNRSLSFSSGIPVQHGIHYIHIAFADDQNLPLMTRHFRFSTYADPIQVNSPTHPDQSQWYDNSNFQINIENTDSNLTYRYIIDDYPETIPNSSSALVDYTSHVFVNQAPGTHYLHIQLFDVLGATGQPLHFRYNIYDSDEPKPAPLPVVTRLYVNPTSVTKDGTISIEGTIEIK
jgi:hypothetical protein